MNPASAYLDDTDTLPRPARHVHLYLAAVDGVIVAADAKRRPAACMRTGTSALPSDILDRSLRITLPDTTATTIDYGFGPDRNGATQFKTTVTDANQKTKESYRDVRELITSVKEFNKGAGIWTSYRYDPLKQIVEVSDARGNLTRAEYDNLGRRTLIDNPDTLEMGRVIWEGWFSLSIPTNWLYHQEGDVIVIYDEISGVGAIQISCVRRDKKSQPDLIETIKLAEMFAQERGWRLQQKEIASYQIDNSPASEFVFIERADEPTFWQVWHIVGEKRAVFITYNCSLTDADKELTLRQQIIKSFKWQPA